MKTSNSGEYRTFLRCPISYALVIFLSFVSATTFAQNVEGIEAREVRRRAAAAPHGDEALAAGRVAMQERNYAVAHEQFRIAAHLLSGRSREEAVKGFCESGVKLAETRIAEGLYAQAEELVQEVLNPQYDPNCRPALELLAHLETPGYYNKTMGPKFIAKVEEVKNLLTEAEGYYQSARYDLAFKKYEQVLALDPYNTAARRGEERLDNTKYHYGDDAYNETRGRQLADVQTAWQQPVRQYGPSTGAIVIPATANVSDTARIARKLNSIIIPRIEFRDASIREAIDFVRQQAIENDPSTEGKRGVDIVLRLVPLGQVAPPAGPVAPAPPPAPAGSPGAPGTGVPPAAPAAVPAAPATSAAGARITLSLNEIPLGEALRYIAAQAGLKVKVEPYAVSMVPLSEQSTDLITKRYHVPPEFFGGPLDVGFYLSTGLGGGGASTGGSQGAGGAQAVQPAPVATGEIDKSAASFQSTAATGVGPAGATSTSLAQQATLTTRQQLVNDRQLVERADAKTFLQSMGVSFSAPGSSATFFPHSATLVVRNTPDNLDMVDVLVDQANAAGPKQVEIESKFIEISQNNLKELGFDWLLGPFNIGNHKLFGSGGTSGTGTPVNSNFPVLDSMGNPVGGAQTPFSNSNGIGTGGGPVTAGNRSGTFAISANALDALLAGATGGASTVAPGIFGLAGVFTDPQFQVVIRALNQKKGIDLLSAPKVTTKSGQRAIIEIIREFRYPTSFTPPQVPSISSTTGTTMIGAASVVPVVVTPTTPQNFETRNVGVTLEVEPVVGADGATIDLNLVPQVVEFEGFINYGSPINAVGVQTVAGISTSAPVVLTENVINQPIFSTRKVTTSVQVADGQTVVLGGLMREDVQKTEDRTPIVGDIPLVGRLFRTNVDQHIKRNLIIFVTAKRVTPVGQIPSEEEEEEALQPPVLPEIPLHKK
jgi:general secretion pathway protein D